jgi:hypothetical protein
MSKANPITNVSAIFKRELTGYFGSPVAYVFIVIFLLLAGFFTFNISHFFEMGQADLRSFFQWHPWIFLFLVPSVAMRLWAEERRLGTLELLLTLPVTLTQVILGKFLAAWIFLGISLLLTFPLIITTTYLGNPDLGAIRDHDILTHPKSGNQLYSGGCHLPFFYSRGLYSGNPCSFRMGAVVDDGNRFTIEFSDTFCIY